MENELRRDALGVLQDAMSWRLAEDAWTPVEQAIQSLATALASGDDAAFDEALYHLELAGPIRGYSAQTAQTTATEPVRVLTAEVVHSLEEQGLGDETSSAPG